MRKKYEIYLLLFVFLLLLLSFPLLKSKKNPPTNHHLTKNVSAKKSIVKNNKVLISGNTKKVNPNVKATPKVANKTIAAQREQDKTEKPLPANKQMRSTQMPPRVKPKTKPTKYCCYCLSSYAIKNPDIIPSYNLGANLNFSDKSLDKFVFANFLYWKTQEEGNDLGFEWFIAPQGLPNHESGRKVITLKNKYKPGFRVGAGMELGLDNWLMLLDYTFMHTTQKRSDTASNIYVYWMQEGEGYTSYTGKWTLHYDIICLKLFRPYYVGSHLIFKPTYGLKSGIINQKYKSSGQKRTTHPYYDESNHKSKSWLIGPRATVETSWIIAKRLKFIGDFGLSLFYQKFYDVKMTHFDSQYNNTHYYYSEDRSYLRTSLETNIGFVLGRYFQNYSMHWDLALTYECQYYFNQNMLRNLITKVPSPPPSHTIPIGVEIFGDLMLHGLNLKLKCDF